MKKLMLILGMCLILTSPVMAIEMGNGQGAYEFQLSSYKTIFDSFLKDYESKNVELIDRYEVLKTESIRLNKEHKVLQQAITSKEEDMDRLKEVNQKMDLAYKELQGQYDDLETLFLEQKAETNKMKKEVEASKVIFYQKLIESYEEENKMLSVLLEDEDDSRIEKIEMMKERQSEIQASIKEMKEMIVSKGIDTSDMFNDAR